MSLYVQRGEVLDYTNETEETITYGTALVLNDIVGIAVDDIEAGETGAVAVSGVFKVTNTATDAVSLGQTIYFDGTGFTTESGGTEAGYAAGDFDAGSETINIKLKF